MQNSQDLVRKNPVELLFSLNQKSKDLSHYRAIWKGTAPLKTPIGFRFEREEIGLRPYDKALDISTSHRAGKTLLSPEPRIDARALVTDLAAKNFALVNQELYLQEGMSQDGKGIMSIKLIARYLLRDRDDLFEDERELDLEMTRVWAHNLIALTAPFFWEVSAFQNPTSDERYKTHINFKKRMERPKELEGVRLAPNVLRLEDGGLTIKAA